jgi:hypothetical protein
MKPRQWIVRARPMRLELGLHGLDGLSVALTVCPRPGRFGRSLRDPEDSDGLSECAIQWRGKAKTQFGDDEPKNGEMDGTLIE